MARFRGGFLAWALLLPACATGDTGLWREIHCRPGVAGVGGSSDLFGEPAVIELLLAGGGRIELKLATGTSACVLRKYEPDGSLAWTTDVGQGVDADESQGGLLAGAFHANDGGGADAAALTANERQAFLVLYSRYTTGADVFAIDLVTHAPAWSRSIRPFGRLVHSRYRNDVSVELVRGHVVVRGTESVGCYTRVFRTDGTPVPDPDAACEPGR